MKKNGKRILSIFLAAVIAVTTVGYAPPFTSSASWKTNMEKALELLASPSEASKQESTATPSEAESPGREATPSEAEIPDGKATPSQAVKKFVRVEPEELPEYYSQVSASGKRFWKFEDRNGMVQYRDYGFMQGEAEFPLWYTSDLAGAVDGTAESVNLDEEYYNLAPYIYKSIAPDQTAWKDLSWKIFSNIDEINDCTRKKISGFKNWNSSGYYIWHLVSKDEEEDEEDLGYHFYGSVINEEVGEGQPGWYYSDENGNIRPILQIKTMMVASAENTAKITFDANGGTIYKQSVYEKDVSPGEYLKNYFNFDDLKKNTIRTGYTFMGWYENSDGTGSMYSDYSKITEDKTVYAKWSKVRNSVIFYRNYPQGDKEFWNQKSIYYGDQIGEFPDVYQVGKGLELKGWYLNEYCTGNPVTPDQIMGDSPLNLYAKWGDFDVTYKIHYGYGIDETNLPSEIKAKSTVDAKNLAKNYLPKLSSNYLFVPGYFNGWWTDEPDYLHKVGKVIYEGSTDNYWFPTKHETDLYLNKTLKYIAIDLYYPLYSDGSDSSMYGVGSTPYALYGEILPKGIMQSIMGLVPSGKKFYGLYYDEKRTQPIDFSLPLYPHDPHDETTNFVRLKVYMKCAKETSIITFKDYDGSIIKQEPVNFGEDIPFPDDPVRSGYTFIGWDKDLGNTSNLLTDTVVIAQYDKNHFKLILDANGGSLSSKTSITMDVKSGDSLDQSLADGKNNASRKYHTFTGWYTASLGGSKCPESGNVMPSTDLTVYAMWERSSSEVTFKDWNGAAIDRQEVLIGADATPPEVPERPGYTFTGWDKPTTNIQDHTDVTAQYSINGYLLTLDGNGGTLEESPKKEVVVSFDQSFDQILVDGKDQVKRPGYYFEGWYTSASGGTSYSYSGNQMPSINVTVFAHWSPNTYKIIFDPDHERWTRGGIKEDHAFDTQMGTLPTPDIYGWKLTGWWTGKSGSGSRVTAQSMIEPKDMIYYGNWEPITYEVHFLSKAQQPEGESVQTFTVNQTYDQVFRNFPEPEEKGYTFTGWYDEGNKKLNPQSIFQPVSGAEGVTYHAGWKANSYKIRLVYFDADGKQVSIEMNQEYPSQLGTLPTPEKPGYTFIGWFKDNGEEVTAGSWVEAGDVEYKARWKANQYTIHFERNLPESEIMEDPEDKTVTYTLPIGVLPYLNETGYVFLGWFTEQEGGSRIRETTLAALGDQTYYGHWSIGIIDNGNGTHRRPGDDGKWNTTDDELWWNGLDGISQTSDDKWILTFINGRGSYADNGNGTHYRPGVLGSWTSGIELWWNGADGIPGTDDDIRIYNGGNGSSGTPIYYIDSGNGIYIRPGASGDWGIGTEYWWYGPDGIPGTADDRQIYIIPGGSGYYMDYGNGTYIKPGTGGSWTSGTEHWWYGPDGKPGTSDDRQIHIIPGGSGYYIDNGDGTYIKPGTGGSWTSGTEHWWYGPDGTPGTSDDRQIHIIPGGSGYYIDNGDGTYILPGTGGRWTSGTEYWWYGPDGKPGTSDDKQIHIIPGGSGYYIDNGDGTYIKPGIGGSWTSGTEHWWYGPDGTPGTSDDKQIHIIPGGSGYYIDNGDGTYIKPGTGGSWTSGTEHWWYGPDGTPGTSDDKQIHIIPGGSGYYIDNGDGTYIKPGTGGSWTSGTEHGWYGPDGKPGTSDDRQIHSMPGGNGYYIDNGDGTHIRPGTGGSWDHGTEIWQNGPDGKPGTPDDYKKVDNGNTDPEPTKPDPTKPDPTDPEPTKPEPTDPEPTKPEPSKPDPVKPEPTNPSNETKTSKEDSEAVTVPGTPSIDSTSKSSVRDDGGTFKVDPENPKDVTYIKPDGSPVSNEWIGDGANLYHVNEDSKLDYDWFLVDEVRTWFMLNNKSGENFGAAIKGWYSEPMDEKKYFFDPSTTKMLTGWQRIDGKSYYFTTENEGQTYFGSNRTKWKYDPLRPGKPHGSMYQNEYTPDGYWVDENGICADKK